MNKLLTAVAFITGTLFTTGSVAGPSGDYPTCDNDRVKQKVLLSLQAEGMTKKLYPIAKHVELYDVETITVDEVLSITYCHSQLDIEAAKGIHRFEINYRAGYTKRGVLVIEVQEELYKSVSKVHH